MESDRGRDKVDNNCMKQLWFVVALGWAGCSDDEPEREVDVAVDVAEVDGAEVDGAEVDGVEVDAVEAEVDAVAEAEVDAVEETVRVVLSATTDGVPNPDRGFYTFIDDLETLTAEDLEGLDTTLVYTPIRLDVYRARAIDATELALLSKGMDLVREAGLGLILRFTYNYPENEQDYLDAADAPLDRVREHITALTPVIAAHADIITFWQAGFIGAWGEWHTSSNDLTTDANKLAVRDALLAALPPDAFLQFRYPPDLVRWIPGVPDGSSYEFVRMGFHNDCFMSSDTDVGTFEGGLDDPQRAAMAALTAVSPFGGETCDADDGGGLRLGCEHILAEGARYHLTYLNRDYHTAFHDRWKAEGCFDEVTSKLGYRLEIQAVEHPAVGRVGDPVHFVVTIDNSGWSRPFVHRRFAFFLGETEVATSLDVRSVAPGVASYDAWVRLPEAALGTHEVSVGFVGAGRPLRFRVGRSDLDRIALGTRLIVTE